MTQKHKNQKMENNAEEINGKKTETEEKVDDHVNEKSSRKDRKDKSAEKIQELEQLIADKDDKYLRLQAEFDNYRKRTLKEKMDLIKSGGESLLINILPVIDDFDRAIKMMETAQENTAIAEGVNLIYKRFNDFLQQNGVKEIEAIEKEFDLDLHEAITKIPAPNEALKGKVVDVVQKGYYLNDKVIRFAKVVIGE
ncbi:MAG: nucleotide exchange factor GrpE [Prolixibacteraceae bacterium]|nr:nucleotide exchange factor GrpE [Prolixibacteraceae bacterium]